MLFDGQWRGCCCSCPCVLKDIPHLMHFVKLFEVRGSLSRNDDMTELDTWAGGAGGAEPKVDERSGGAPTPFWIAGWSTTNGAPSSRPV